MASGTAAAPVQPAQIVSIAEIHALVLDLTNPEKREAALVELSKKRESVQDLAPILWHSFGTIAALLQEIVSIYPLLAPPKLKSAASNRVCNALALLQCVASHHETRSFFLSAHIPLFLYPFLNTVSKTRPFEYLRLTSLGVIGALVKADDSEVISFLLNTEIIPLCLRIMETGSELSKTVATFIVQKILLDEHGLNNYICATFERFQAVVSVLGSMVVCAEEPPSPRLLKHIIRCYLRLTDNPRAREVLHRMLPDCFLDGSVLRFLKDDKDPLTRKWLNMLYMNLGIVTTQPQPPQPSLAGAVPPQLVGQAGLLSMQQMHGVGVGMQGVGMQGVGMQGVGMQGVGMQGVGMQGVGMQGVGMQMQASQYIPMQMQGPMSPPRGVR
eukprot:m51a1_g9222 putative cell differentiation protein rcd1 homolog (385) ;mRNA; f:64563-66159